MKSTTALSQVGAFTGQTLASIQAAIDSFSAGLFTPGNIYFLDPANGSDASGVGSLAAPFQTLGQAYAQCVAGNNDCVVLVGNGATTGTARLNAAFTWAKNAQSTADWEGKYLNAKAGALGENVERVADRNLVIAKG